MEPNDSFDWRGEISHSDNHYLTQACNQNKGFPQALFFKCQMNMCTMPRLFAIVLISGHNSCLWPETHKHSVL